METFASRTKGQVSLDLDTKEKKNFLEAVVLGSVQNSR